MVKLICDRVTGFVLGLIEAVQGVGAVQMKLIPIPVEVRAKRRNRR